MACNVSCACSGAQQAITCDDDPFTSLVDWVPAIFIAVPVLVAAGAVAWHCLRCRKPWRSQRDQNRPLLPSGSEAEDAEATGGGPPAEGSGSGAPLHVATRDSAMTAQEEEEIEHHLAVERLSRFGGTSGASESDFETAAARLVDYFPLEMPAARVLLLGTGVLRPARRVSIWWLCWASWRLLALALLAFYVGPHRRVGGLAVRSAAPRLGGSVGCHLAPRPPPKARAPLAVGRMPAGARVVPRGLNQPVCDLCGCPRHLALACTRRPAGGARWRARAPRL